MSGDLDVRRVDIGRVLKRLGIDAKQRGREWTALCPNPTHKDRAPSWRVRDEPGSSRHGKHHCYPCDFGGSVVDLVMTLRVLDYRGAMEWLEGADVGMSAEPLAGAVRVDVLSTIGFRMPDGVVFGPLCEWVTPARRYAESRGITGEQVDRWGLGYAVDGKLEGRIVVPYRNAHGTPLGYTARTFLDDDRRYREPHPDERPWRSVMFGEQHWPAALEHPELSPILVTEGALNALAVERAFPNAFVGALAGSTPNPAHVDKLSRFGHVVLLTDPDAAGDRVAAQLAGLLARYTRVSRVRLPEGTDASDLPMEELQRWVSTVPPTWARS